MSDSEEPKKRRRAPVRIEPMDDSALHDGLKRHGVNLGKEHFPITSEPIRDALVGMVAATEEKQRRINNLIHANQQLEELSETDSLTQLPNNRAIRRELDAMLKRRRSKTPEEGTTRGHSAHPPAVLIWVDINNFKHFNDTYSAVSGNLALKHIARLLHGADEHTSGLIREADFVGRPHGDEFAIIMYDTPQEKAKEVMDRVIRKVAEAPFTYHHKPDATGAALAKTASTLKEGTYELNVGITYGLTDFRENDTLSSITARASRAMKKNKPKKHLGENTVETVFGDVTDSGNMDTLPERENEDPPEINDPDGIFKDLNKFKRPEISEGGHREEQKRRKEEEGRENKGRDMQ